CEIPQQLEDGPPRAARIVIILLLIPRLHEFLEAFSLPRVFGEMNQFPDETSLGNRGNVQIVSQEESQSGDAVVLDIDASRMCGKPNWLVRLRFPAHQADQLVHIFRVVLWPDNESQTASKLGEPLID